MLKLKSIEKDLNGRESLTFEGLDMPCYSVPGAKPLEGKPGDMFDVEYDLPGKLVGRHPALHYVARSCIRRDG